jgi:dUTP pyrophosphatase
MKTLYIKPLSQAARDYYALTTNNKPGDAGFDLAFMEEVIFEPDNLIQLISFQISIYVEDEKGNNVGVFITPRSSIYKTPFRQANSIGIIDAGYRGALMCPIEVTSAHHDKAYAINLHANNSGNNHADSSRVEALVDSVLANSVYYKKHADHRYVPFIPAKSRLFQIVDPGMKGFKVVVLDEAEDLPSSVRGSDSFGSTGL